MILRLPTWCIRFLLGTLQAAAVAEVINIEIRMRMSSTGWVVTEPYLAYICCGVCGQLLRLLGRRPVIELEFPAIIYEIYRRKVKRGSGNDDRILAGALRRAAASRTTKVNIMFRLYLVLHENDGYVRVLHRNGGGKRYLAAEETISGWNAFARAIDLFFPQGYNSVGKNVHQYLFKLALADESLTAVPVEEMGGPVLDFLRRSGSITHRRQHLNLIGKKLQGALPLSLCLLCRRLITGVLQQRLSELTETDIDELKLPRRETYHILNGFLMNGRSANLQSLSC